MWYQDLYRHKSHLINLIYIRAAIRERTGQDLPLGTVLKLLVEEGLVTPAQARDRNLIFKGYADYFETEAAASKYETADRLIDKEFLHEDDESEVQGIQPCNSESHS